MPKYRITYKHHHREDSSYEHEDYEAPTAREAVLDWLTEYANNLAEGDSLLDVLILEQDCCGEVYPTVEQQVQRLLEDESLTEDELNKCFNFAFWPGGSDCDIFKFIYIEPCRWVRCPTCKGAGEIETEADES